MMKNLYQIVGDYGSDFHAGPKAQRDVTEILSRLGWKPFGVRRHEWSGLIGRFFNRLDWQMRVWWLRCKLPNDCTLFMQYPTAAWSKAPSMRLVNEKVKREKGLTLITLIHDISSLRWGKEPFGMRQLASDEFELMRLADVLIVHNEAMKAALVARGVSAEKMRCLTVFDYRTSCKFHEKLDFSPTVVIAGNLNPDKAGYLDGLAKITDVEWNLYGLQFNPERLKGGNVHFNGCFSPEELPGKLEGSFGLIWDGPSTETCTGDLGNYLRINNPHKLSLFLASGLPVIIWDEAAEARFVQENGVGLCVSSLRDVGKLVKGLTVTEYQEIRFRAVELGKKLREGSFIAKAISGLW